jgi:hypothetical protein
MARERSRVYWVDYTTKSHPKTISTIRIVADGKLSRVELKDIMVDHEVPANAKIVKVRSEAID